MRSIRTMIQSSRQIALVCMLAVLSPTVWGQVRADVYVQDKACNNDSCQLNVAMEASSDVPAASLEALTLDLQRTGRLNPTRNQSGATNLRVKKDGATLTVELWKQSTKGQAADAVQRFGLSNTAPRWTGHAIADWVTEQLLAARPQFKSRLVFVSRMQERGRINYALVVADSDGQNRHVLFKSNHPVAMPQWSPDGALIAYVGHMPYGMNLLPKARVWIIDPFKGSNRVLADFAGANTAPAWSPDGKYIWLALEKDGPAKVYRLPANGGEPPARLTTASANVLETEPTVSPKGAVAWSTDKSGAFQVYQSGVDGSNNPTWVKTNLTEAFAPTYSRDGAWLAVTGKGAKGTELVVINSQTGQARSALNAAGLGRAALSATGAISTVHARVGQVCELISVANQVANAHPIRLGEGCDPSWGPVLP